MKTPTEKLPLGGPAWLRAIADDKDEMLHAIGTVDLESEKEERREIQGLRDAADRMERLEKALFVFVEAVEDCGPDERFVRIDACVDDIKQAREALA